MTSRLAKLDGLELGHVALALLREPRENAERKCLKVYLHSVLRPEVAEVGVSERVRLLVLEAGHPQSPTCRSSPGRLMAQLDTDDPQWILGRHLLVNQERIPLVVRATAE